MIKIVDGEEVEMSDDEIAEFNAMQAEAANSIVFASPSFVSARQFKLQLLAAGILDQVDAWVASQPRAVQIAYEYSGSFVRTEPMMTAGFESMGFTPQQVDDFFIAASKR